ncbi:C39 family peptidase [Candidatus Gottesmanbacteria bacterium]|nr:C39 family peptidase [Candidatus Gottesmanbacteria bacterium]
MNGHLPKKYTLSIRPKEYLKQGPSHCGVYSVKAILSAYGLDDKIHPKYYHPNLFHQETGMTWGNQYYTNILSKYGIGASMKSAKESLKNEKLNVLKNLLSRNTPVMIRIGNGYASKIYNSLMGKLVAHWITLWGYDDDKRIFYAYDSGLPKKYWNKTQHVGNTIRTYDEILRDWSFGKWQPWAWPVTGPRKYVYIELKTKNNGRN